jgi:hypothetical protein
MRLDMSVHRGLPHLFQFDRPQPDRVESAEPECDEDAPAQRGEYGMAAAIRVLYQSGVRWFEPEPSE